MANLKEALDFLVDKIKTVKSNVLLKIDFTSRVNVNNANQFAFFDVIIPNDLPDNTVIQLRNDFVITNTSAGAVGSQFLIEFDGVDEVDTTLSPFTIASIASLSNFGYFIVELTYIDANNIFLSYEIVLRRGQANGGSTVAGAWNGNKRVTKVNVKKNNKVLRLKQRWGSANALCRFESLHTKTEQR